MRWKHASLTAIGFTAVSAVVLAPMVLHSFDGNAGVRAYASYWQVNDTIYRGLHLLGGWLVPHNAHFTARILAGLILLALIAWLCRRPAANGRETCERALWTTAAIFLLSPTQYPWYWLWMLPLLAVRPSPGLLVLTATLPLYYLRFPLREMGYQAWFDYGVVWIQFAPCFALLCWEAWRAHRPAAVAQHDAAWSSMSSPTVATLSLPRIVSSQRLTEDRPPPSQR